MAKFEYTSTDLEEKVLAYFAEQNGAATPSAYFAQVVSSSLAAFITEFEEVSKDVVRVEVESILSRGGSFSVSKDLATGLVTVTK